MRQIRFEGSRDLDARPEVVWDIVSDYHEGHPLIVPRRAFGDITVERGGKGDGTVITFPFHAAGVKRIVRHVVSTPEPGRVLVEAEADGSGATTWTFTPLDGGTRTRVQIVTEAPGHDGLLGLIERLALPRVSKIMAGIYQEELSNLEALAQSRQAAAAREQEAV